MSKRISAPKVPKQVVEPVTANLTDAELEAAKLTAGAEDQGASEVTGDVTGTQGGGDEGQVGEVSGDQAGEITGGEPGEGQGDDTEGQSYLDDIEGSKDAADDTGDIDEVQDSDEEQDLEEEEFFEVEVEQEAPVEDVACSVDSVAAQRLSRM